MLALLASSSGCGSTDIQPASSATDTSAASPPATTTRTTPAPPKPTLTGYGATRAAWDANHDADTRGIFTEGSAYEADPSLPRGGDAKFNDKYYAVTEDGGRIITYSMRFPPGTSVTEARHEVLDSEFPSDARGKLRTLGSCAPMSVKSGTLRREAHTSATVEFSSGDGTTRAMYGRPS